MVAIRPIDSQCASAFKAVRLNALQDTPMAFGSTFAKESRFSDAEWEQRMARWNSDRSICCLAWDDDRPCGIVAGLLDQEQAAKAHLVSMWVAPSHRRCGVGQLLVEGIVQWASEQRAELLCLAVTSTNEVAARFYERLGFKKTGKTEPYPNDSALVECEMVRSLTLVAVQTAR